WGHPLAEEPQPPQFSEEGARAYFEHFLPSTLSAANLKELTGGSTTITFHIDGLEPLGWLLKSVDGHVAVERLQPEEKQSGIHLRAGSDAFMSLITGKTSLPKTLLFREARLEGPPLELLRFATAFARFLKEHPYTPQAAKESEPSIPAGAAT